MALFLDTDTWASIPFSTALKAKELSLEGGGGEGGAEEMMWSKDQAHLCITNSWIEAAIYQGRWQKPRRSRTGWKYV